MCSSCSEYIDISIEIWWHVFYFVEIYETNFLPFNQSCLAVYTVYSLGLLMKNPASDILYHGGNYCDTMHMLKSQNSFLKILTFHNISMLHWIC